MVSSPEWPEEVAKGKGLKLEQPPSVTWKATRAWELHFKTRRQPDNLITRMAHLSGLWLCNPFCTAKVPADLKVLSPLIILLSVLGQQVWQDPLSPYLQ